jgi:hypothetical protein
MSFDVTPVLALSNFAMIYLMLGGLKLYMVQIEIDPTATAMEHAVFTWESDIKGSC